jgi:hypothetical protein
MQRSSRIGLGCAVVALLGLGSVLVVRLVAAPTVHIATPVHHFGSVARGATLSTEFPLKNLGPGSLRIEAVDAECRCTAIVLDPEVAVGQTGRIKVSLETWPFEGPIEKRVHLTIAGVPDHRITLTVKATVEPEFVLSAATIDLGRSDPQESVVRRLTIVERRPASARVLTATSTDPGVRVSLARLPANPDTLHVVVTRASGAIAGWHLSTVVLTTTSAVNPEVRIPLRGRVAPANSNGAHMGGSQ